MLRIASLLALALPLAACLGPTEVQHTVSWRHDGVTCDAVRMTVYMESGRSTFDNYDCNAFGEFTWTTDDPPVSVELEAYHSWEEACDDGDWFCSGGTHTESKTTGTGTGVIDPGTDATELVILPVTP